MKLKLSLKYFLAFIPLIFLMGETHELVHTSVGRMICGCWGARDFNVWGLCKGCKDTFPNLSIMATFAGPFYSYIIVWIGYFLLGKDKSSKSKAWGITLIASNILFARILTSAFASGDEVYGLKRLFDSLYIAWPLGLSIVVLLSLPPLIRVYKTIQNEKKNSWFIGVLILPFAIAMVGAIILNSLLKGGLLNEVWILGSPKLITYWLIFISVGFLFTYKNITRLQES